MAVSASETQAQAQLGKPFPETQGRFARGRTRSAKGAPSTQRPPHSLAQPSLTATRSPSLQQAQTLKNATQLAGATAASTGMFCLSACSTHCNPAKYYTLTLQISEISHETTSWLDPSMRLFSQPDLRATDGRACSSSFP